MEIEKRLEVIKHIKLGTDEVLYYPYNRGSDPLPLRPISSYELDQCFYKALKFAPEKIASLVIKIRLGLIKGDRNIDVSNEGYVSLLEFYNNVNYWIVYFGMKDFQEDSFSKPNYDDMNDFPNGFSIVKKMKEVHNIANFIVNSSYETEEVIKEIFKDDIGREVAYVVFYLGTPLSNVKDLTKLQRDYLIYSKTNLGKITKEEIMKKKYLISGETMSFKELKERLL